MVNMKKRNLERLLLTLAICVATVALYIGWESFWFLTDDAYIAFRYVSNSQLGHGYVWNPPPFQPVEGYTSFLWVVILDLAWSIFGVEPPDSANWISLGFSFGTLLIGLRLLARALDWSQLMPFTRLTLAVLFLVFTVGNRTVLAWSSSGLETAMMGFFLLLWVDVNIGTRPATTKALWCSLVAVALTLTRPDGLLFCASSIAIVALLAMKAGPKQLGRILWMGLTPMLLVGAHLT